MTIKIQKSIPSNNTGKPGEMLLVSAGGGLYLYIKGYSHWGSMKLSNTATDRQDYRNKRTTLQAQIRQVITLDEDTAENHGKGTIAGGGGGGGAKSGMAEPPPGLPRSGG